MNDADEEGIPTEAASAKGESTQVIGLDDLVDMAADAVGERVQIVGDDYLVTNVERVKRGVSVGACNALLVKPNQVGTLTETKAAFEAARDAGWTSILSARSGETEDVTIVHLAVGWGVRQLKVGSFARSERMAKWNEALRIEEALGERSIFAEADMFPAQGNSQKPV